MSYRCCYPIQISAMQINGRLDMGEPIIGLCCENLPNLPKLRFQEKAEDTLRAFVGESALISAECALSPEDDQRHFTAGCAGCANFRDGDYHMDGLIHYVNLSMYPAPCQSRCFYCSVHKEDQSVNSDMAQVGYEKLFDVLELANCCGIIAPDAKWQISSGEITIHPYRDRIMELVRGKRAVFHTNCMKFDEDIAQNLHDNSNSAINLSIDAGTPETWKKVKGVDNFDKVTENLTRYYARSARPGQITLKYIVLPGVNDSYEDYRSLMELMKALRVKHLTLSRDTQLKYSMSRQERIKLIEAAAHLMAMCRKNRITYDLIDYTQEEEDEAARLAKEIRRRRQI